MLPYLQGFHKAPEDKGVTVYKEGLVHPGLNFFTSGHSSEAALMDMQGNVLHLWKYPIHKVWPDIKPDENTSYWRKAYLFANGDILALWEGKGMIKLDRDSRLLWKFRQVSKEDRHYPHHEMDVNSEGNVLVLTRRLEDKPKIFKHDPIYTEHIVVLDAQGKIIDQCPLIEALERSDHAHLLQRIKQGGDVLHSNTLKVLDGRHVKRSPIFAQGNVLICILKLDLVAIVDMQQKKVVWAAEGRKDERWDNIHDSVLLENGNILLFKNNEPFAGKERSRVIEFDPFTLKILWQYAEDGPTPFFSDCCGANQRLPNENTLITDTENGRVVEVTREGEIVWQYLNPQRVGKKSELIASILHMQRVGPQYVKWLRGL